MNENIIEVYGVVSDLQRGMKAFKIDDRWDATPMHQFTLTDDEGNKFNVFVLENNCECKIENGLHCYVKGAMNDKGILVAGYVDRWGRYCDHCGKHHEEGYYSEDTSLYFCSDECLEAEYTQEEIEEERERETLFWTEWYN